MEFEVCRISELCNKALKNAVDHGFNENTVGEELALIHSEISEALECFRESHEPYEMWYEETSKKYDRNLNVETIIRLFHSNFENENGKLNKPCGIPSEMADVLIRIFHFAGKHKIDLERAVCEKMMYNSTRPFKHGNKKI